MPVPSKKTPSSRTAAGAPLSAGCCAPLDYIVLEPKQCAFYGTPLEILLDYLKVRRLVIAGLSADICIFFTAQDACVRDYDIWIPSDGVASQSMDGTAQALADMQRLFAAKICRVPDVKWSISRKKS